MSRGVPPLLGFAGRRLLRGLVTIWFAVTVTFLLLRLLPGDPALAVASENMTPEIRAALLHDYGLDRPLIVQYGKYLWELLHGNLGISFAQQQPVIKVLGEQLPWTLLLMATSMVITLAVGVPLGVAAARRPGGLVDRGSQIFSVAAGSLFVPSAGIGLLFLFGLTLHWLPIGGGFPRPAPRPVCVLTPAPPPRPPALHPAPGAGRG